MSKNGVRAALLAVLLAAFLSPSPAAAERRSIGYLENVRIYPGAVAVRAKIDSGAATSSLDVGKIEEFDLGGEPWVRFRLAGRDGKGPVVERPLVRLSSVRRSGTERQIRYVINLGICLGGYYNVAQINLSDRSGMNYRMLIGRRFLEDKFLIDASAKYLTKPECADAPNKGAPKK